MRRIPGKFRTGYCQELSGQTSRQKRRHTIEFPHTCRNREWLSLLAIASRYLFVVFGFAPKHQTQITTTPLRWNPHLHSFAALTEHRGTQIAMSRPHASGARSAMRFRAADTQSPICSFGANTYFGRETNPQAHVDPQTEFTSRDAATAAIETFSSRRKEEAPQESTSMQSDSSTISPSSIYRAHLWYHRQHRRVGESCRNWKQGLVCPAMNRGTSSSPSTTPTDRVTRGASTRLSVCLHPQVSKSRPWTQRSFIPRHFSTRQKDFVITVHEAFHLRTQDSRVEETCRTCSKRSGCFPAIYRKLRHHRPRSLYPRQTEWQRGHAGRLPCFSVHPRGHRHHRPRSSHDPALSTPTFFTSGTEFSSSSHPG